MNWLDRALAAPDAFVVGEVTVGREGDSFVVNGPGTTGRADRPGGGGELRDRIRTDRFGRYRPLSGARTMPGDWEVPCANQAELVDTLDVIYPLAVRHIEQAASGTLRVTTIEAVLERQSGRYEAANGLAPRARDLAVEVVCGMCARTPAWAVRPPVGAGTIPCPEACSVLVGFCREAALWDGDPPAPQPPSKAGGFAEFDTPGNELRETYLGRRFDSHRPAEEPTT